MRFSSNSRRILDAAVTAYGRFPREEHPRVEFSVNLDPVQGRDPSPDPVYEVTEESATVCFAGATHVVVDLARNRVEGQVAANLIGHESAFRYHVLQFILAVVLKRHGFMGFHAAACVRDGRAVLLRGASGSGKTTLALAAVRNGWQTLGESVLWLDTKRDPVCWGLPWWFHLPAETAAPAFTVNGRARTEIDMEAEYPGSTVVRATAGALVFVEKHSSQSRIEPLTPDQARTLWMCGAAGRESEFPGYPSQVERFMTLPAYRLAFGTGIDDVPRLLEILPRPARTASPALCDKLKNPNGNQRGSS